MPTTIRSLKRAPNYKTTMITNLIRVLSGRTLRPYRFAKGGTVDYKRLPAGFGLYVHIPFCETICSFCPYNKTEYDRDLCSDYIEALLGEIKLVGEKTGRRTAGSLYFGGGSPTLLGERLTEILDVTGNYYDIKGEIAIEVNIADLNEPLVDSLRSQGFTMVSVGVQSFSKKALRALGRPFVEDAGERVKTAASAGFDTVDVDLIFGIPGQTPDGLKADFGEAVASGATQISTYPFIDFSYADNGEKPLGKREKREMLSALVAVSESYGFERSSVWSFTRAGTRKYSSITREAFIGFGASAATLLADTFAVNSFSIEGYIGSIEEGDIPTALSLDFDTRTRAGYWLFWKLYEMNIGEDRFRAIFGEGINVGFGWELVFARVAGWLKKNGAGYRLTERGAYVYHLLEQEYTRKYIDKLWGALRDEAWPGEITVW
ncbi:MAG: radical SAM protein [bacterium]|nr:radical SAM protein [bacterium]